MSVSFCGRSIEAPPPPEGFPKSIEECVPSVCVRHKLAVNRASLRPPLSPLVCLTISAHPQPYILFSQKNNKKEKKKKKKKKLKKKHFDTRFFLACSSPPTLPRTLLRPADPHA
ncbi:unnamed protein product [Caenorhabditis auriculariae]|uniref:Uncharacterized protein n=1 Tax=Caenorhabditis auriculariae TaxID=2777116 RepID=A0A8S1HI65_9PELO|nr:unnamed protein product [Caenorhabditis auriculariae]